MAEPPRNARQNRTYSGTVASDHSRQQNGDQHHRYEGVGAVYHGDVQRVATPTGRGSILSPTRWITTRENGEALINAARQGQVERMRRLFGSKYTEIDFMDKEKTTPLLAAIRGKQVAAVTLLLKEGADPGRRYSSSHETPLMSAAKSDCDEIIRALLQHNASANDVQMTRDMGKKVQLSFTTITGRPLIDAAGKGQVDRMNELLCKGYVNVNSIDDRKLTALLAAVENKQSAAVTVLLERGASPDLRYDERCKTPLMLAAYTGNVEIFRALFLYGASLKGIEIGEATVHDTQLYSESEFDALMGGPIDIMRTAIFRCQPTIVFELLQRSVSAQKGALLPALYNLPEENLELIRVLVDAGADVEARNGFDYRPLHHAARRIRFTQTMEILCAAGADLEAQDPQGETVLHFAAFGCPVEGLQKLIALGANIEARDENDCTPLHVATCACRIDVIQILLDSGSNAFAVDKNGKTPYDMACRLTGGIPWEDREKRKVLDLLKSHMDIDEDEAEMKSFVTAYSRSDQRAEMDENDHVSELVMPRESIDPDVLKPGASSIQE